MLYGLLLAVVLAGMTGIMHFIVQEEERVEMEAEKRLALESGEMKDEPQESGGSQPENTRMVLVKELPVYKNKKIVKTDTQADTQILPYGSKVAVLEEDGLYVKIKTENGAVGYVWGDCIGSFPEEEKQTGVQPKVVVIHVETQSLSGLEISGQDAWSLKIAVKLEKKLEARGYTAVMAQRPGEDSIRTAKATELANQIQADAVIHIGTGSSTDAAEGGAAIYCSTSDSAYPAVKNYKDSKKLAKKIIKHYTESTGFANAGVLESDAYPGIQRSKSPVVLLRLGYLTNEDESRRMGKPKFQAKMAGGIADGIDAYFGSGPVSEN